jgi:hypothetical protein
MQAYYESHRRRRNQRQREALLDPNFAGVVIDPVLEKLVAAEATAAAAPDTVRAPAYVDPRHCLVFWARPPAHIRELVGNIQQKLLKAAPSMFLQLHTRPPLVLPKSCVPAHPSQSHICFNLILFDMHHGSCCYQFTLVCSTDR